MQVEVKIDDSCSEPKVMILTASITEEVKNLVQKLSENNPRIISGSKDGRIEILEQNDLVKIYAVSGRVSAGGGTRIFYLNHYFSDMGKRLLFPVRT